MNATRHLLSLLPILTLCAAAPAQSLVANIVTNPGGGGSSGTDPFYVIGNRAVFVASGAFGTELYATNGTPAGTEILIDLQPNGSSLPRDLVVLGNEVLFTAAVPGLGRELWKTDGTTAGTVLVKDIRPGASDSDVDWLVEFGGYVYFAANDASNGNELWRSDGTEAGTVLALDIEAGLSSSLPGRLTPVGSDLYFEASANGLGRELYRIDSLATSVTLVADLSPGAASTVFGTTAAFGSRLLFGANVGNGLEPYVSDGTPAGTFALADLNPGILASNPQDWTVLGSLAVFKAEVSGTGLEPYVTDGTPAGTSSLGDLRPGASGSDPREFTETNGVLVFSAYTNAIGRELWRTDGTPVGTAVLMDVWPGLPGSNAAQFAQVGSEVWFSASSPGIGNELHRTDGTSVSLLADLVPGGGSLNAYGPTVAGNLLLFRGSVGNGGIYEPCVTDGTVAGTLLLEDIARPEEDSSPELFTAFGNDVFFVASTDASGREPHMTDGTSAGTVMLADVEPGLLSSNPTYSTLRGSDMFFDGNLSASGRELFVTTAGGVLALTTGGVEPRGLATNGNLVVFSGVSNGRELWVSDGTVAGTSELLDIQPGAQGSMLVGDDTFVTIGGLTYFVADDGTNGRELWATDGTAAGTDMVLDIYAGAVGSNPGNLTAVGNHLYFTAATAAEGTELWRTDGTAAGTVIVVDLLSGFLGSNPRQLAAAGDSIYFLAKVAGFDEIYICDGTAAGTVAVTDTGIGQVDPYSDLTWTQAGLFFLHDDQTGSGRELWRTTGSLASTQMVLDTAPGQMSGPVEGSLVAVLGSTQLLFSASDLQRGLQLWRSDGTAANTEPVTTFGGNGFGAATLDELVSIGRRTFFACNDGISGIEPWLYDAANSGYAFALPYGAGCSASGIEPVIGSSGLPTVGNGAFEVTLARALPLTVAVPVGSQGSNNISIGTCQLLLDAPFVFQSAVLTDATGAAVSPLSVPANPTLVGFDLFFQWGVLNVGNGPFLNDFDMSNGLQVQVGN